MLGAYCWLFVEVVIYLSICKYRNTAKILLGKDTKITLASVRTKLTFIYNRNGWHYFVEIQMTLRVAQTSDA